MRDEPRAGRRPRHRRLYLPVADTAPEGLESGPDAPCVLYRALTVAEAADFDAANVTLSALKRGDPGYTDAVRALEAVYTRQIVGVAGQVEHYAGNGAALLGDLGGAAIWRALDNTDGARMVNALLGLLSVAEGNG